MTHRRIPDSTRARIVTTSIREFVETHSIEVQTTFNFRVPQYRSRNTGSPLEEAAALLRQHLEQACSSGQTYAPESDVLHRLRSDSQFEASTIARGLRALVKCGVVAREIIEGQPLLFLTELRTAECRIVSIVRRIAEGCPLTNGAHGHLDSFALVCSDDAITTAEATKRMTNKIQRLGYWPILICAGETEAHWYRWRLGRPVYERSAWLRRRSQPFASAREETTMPRAVFLILDASRLGIEDMAEILDSLPTGGAVILVGNPAEAPVSGHGAPFCHLASCGLFQCMMVRLRSGLEELTRSAALAQRTSALGWRLRRAAGRHESDFRWGPVVTEELDASNLRRWEKTR